MSYVITFTKAYLDSIIVHNRTIRIEKAFEMKLPEIPADMLADTIQALQDKGYLIKEIETF